MTISGIIKGAFWFFMHWVPASQLFSASQNNKLRNVAQQPPIIQLSMLLWDMIIRNLTLCPISMHHQMVSILDELIRWYLGAIDISLELEHFSGNLQSNQGATFFTSDNSEWHSGPSSWRTVSVSKVWIKSDSNSRGLLFNNRKTQIFSSFHPKKTKTHTKGAAFELKKKKHRKSPEKESSFSVSSRRIAASSMCIACTPHGTKRTTTQDSILRDVHQPGGQQIPTTDPKNAHSVLVYPHPVTVANEGLGWIPF